MNDYEWELELELMLKKYGDPEMVKVYRVMTQPEKLGLYKYLVRVSLSRSEKL